MNCILYLVRSSDQDVEDFNKSLALLEQNLLPYTNSTDVLVFVEPSFEEYKSKVQTSIELKYETIQFEVPNYPQEILDQIEREATLGLNSPVVLSQLQENIARRRIAVSDFIQNREERRILVGYGAPAKAVTFISEMGLENAEIMAILDDNLSKQGRYLPSSGIPITSKEELIRNLRDLKKDEEPLDFMIFPWNLGAELVSKLKVWAPRNSRVITFFPELQIVSL